MEEVFTYRAQCFDVAATWRRLRCGALPRRPERWDAERLAEKFLREDGEVRARYRAWINLDYARELHGLRLRTPGLLLQGPERSMILDGHHRLVARVLRGWRYMDFYVVHPEEVPRGARPDR